jgi:hypothetical protein
MSYFFNENLEYKGVLQGDVFQVGECCDDIFLLEENFCMVITADCDIANRKMGNSYTCLPIISAEDYLRTVWLEDVIKREKIQLINQMLEIINSSNALKDNDCNSLTAISLEDWLQEESFLTILKLLSLDTQNKKHILCNDLYSVINSDKNFKTFISFRKLQKKSEVKVKKEISDALKNSREEFFFVPDLSVFDSFGAMIKLRDIRAVSHSRVFTEQLELKVSTIDPRKTLIRVGRFSDYLRYSISQKFALLFSRIGMPDSFESDFRNSLGLIANTVWENSNEN